MLLPPPILALAATAAPPPPVALFRPAGASALAQQRGGGLLAVAATAPLGGDLVGRTSENGASWSPTTLLLRAAELGGGRLLNPALVAERSSGSWLLAFNRDPPGAEEMQNCTWSGSTPR